MNKALIFLVIDRICYSTVKYKDWTWKKPKNHMHYIIYFNKKNHPLQSE